MSWLEPDSDADASFHGPPVEHRRGELPFADGVERGALEVGMRRADDSQVFQSPVDADSALEDDDTLYVAVSQVRWILWSNVLQHERRRDAAANALIGACAD